LLCPTVGCAQLEKFEDNKRVIRSRRSKTEIQCTNLQNFSQKITYRAALIHCLMVLYF